MEQMIHKADKAETVVAAVGGAVIAVKTTLARLNGVIKLCSVTMLIFVVHYFSP